MFVINCSPLKVTIDYDKEVSFDNYSSFKIMKHKKRKESISWINNSLNLKRTERAIRDHLLSKGFNEVQSGEVDFLVAYHIGEQKKVDVTYYGYSYRRRPYPGGGTKEVRKYKEGTLIIDIVDRDSKELIWRGYGDGALRDPNYAEEQIYDAVKAILKSFPPK
jgi:hypothetical protein